VTKESGHCLNTAGPIGAGAGEAHDNWLAIHRGCAADKSHSARLQRLRITIREMLRRSRLLVASAGCYGGSSGDGAAQDAPSKSSIETLRLPAVKDVQKRTTSRPASPLSKEDTQKLRNIMQRLLDRSAVVLPQDCDWQQILSDYGIVNLDASAKSPKTLRDSKGLCNRDQLGEFTPLFRAGAGDTGA
jgi:hypothetical protein